MSHPDTHSDFDPLCGPECGVFYSYRSKSMPSVDLERGRKILEMIPRLIARMNELAGVTDIVVNMPTHDYVAFATVLCGRQHIGEATQLHVDGHGWVEVRPREDAEPDRLYIFRREDAPS